MKLGGLRMNKVYGCLFMVLLLCLATAADLLAYISVGGTFFVVGAFVLGALLLLSIFLYGSCIGKLFSLGVFGITLLSGVILFNQLMPENGFVFSLLIFTGIVGFVCTLMCSSCKKDYKNTCSKSKCESVSEEKRNDDSDSYSLNGSETTETIDNVNSASIKQMLMPQVLAKNKKENGKNSMRAPAYKMENKEAGSFATMEALEELSDNDSDDDFVDLKDLENMMEKKTLKKTGKRKKK